MSTEQVSAADTEEVLPLGVVPPEVLQPGFQAWLALVHAYDSVAKTLDRRLTRDLDISLAWFEVLVLLHTAPEGRRRLLELSRLLVVAKASVSKLIDRMEAAGVVRRHTPEDDRRAVYAVITQRGRDTLARALPLQVSNVETGFSSLLDEHDLEDLIRILGKITTHYAGAGAVTPSTALMSATARSGSPGDAGDVDPAPGAPAHPLRKRG
jgi:DNA-binding MarR family transcriptional regulator